MYVLGQSLFRVFPLGRDLFVKRVAGIPGDQVRVDRGGNAYVNGEAQILQSLLYSNIHPDKYRGVMFENSCQFYGTGQQCHLDLESDLLQRLMEESHGTTQVVPRDTSYVLGDCGEVSVDSRVWGPLEDEKVIGRPILRLWPPARFGPIP